MQAISLTDILSNPSVQNLWRSLLTFFILSLPVSAVVCVVRGLGLLKISRKVGVKHGWMAFVPFANKFLIGRIAEVSDNRAYPGKRHIKWSRLNLCLTFVLIAAACLLLTALSVYSVTDTAGGFTPALAIVVLPFFIVVCPAILAFEFTRYAVLYRVYRMMAGRSVIWMLLLSIYVRYASTVLLAIMGFSRRYPVAPPEEPIAHPFIWMPPTRGGY